MIMKKWLVFPIIILIHAFNVRAGDITIGMLDNHQPYSYFDSNSQIQGVAKELLQAISIQSGLKFKVTLVSNYSQLENMLEQKKILIALPPPGMSTTDKKLLLSQPLLEQHWALVVKQERIPLQHETSIDLRHQRVITLKNNPVNAILQANYPGVDINETDSLHEALRLLDAGAAQGIICNATQAALLSSNIYPGKLLVHQLPSIISKQRFIFSSGQEQLKEKIDQAIDSLPVGFAIAVNERWLINSTLSRMQSANTEGYRWFNISTTISIVVSLVLIGYLLSEIFRRKRAERELLDALKYWKTLLNSIPTPLLVCDPLGRITHCNQALLKTLMLTQKDVIDNSLENFAQINPIIPEISHTERISALHSLQPQFSDRIMVIQGQKREMAQWLAAYSDSRFVPQGLLLGWYDISKSKKLERELARALQKANDASKEKSDFLARMSHEIRSPMNAIIGILELESQKSSEVSTSLKVAYSASRQLLKIIGDVLDISKIEAGEMHLVPQPTDLFSLLKLALETYDNLAAKKKIELRSNIKSIQQHQYLIDGPKLTQVISNLLSNAIKYTDNGIISLEVCIVSKSNETDYIHFVVRDTGIGIPLDLQQKILQPYAQVDPSKPASTGLGLTISTQLLRLMGGELAIESTPRQGAKFYFTLPLTRAKIINETHDVGSLPVVESPLNILVIDDLPANLTVMKLQLEKLGNNVVTCDNGADALILLDKEYFDLILTDCQMPHMNGYQFARLQRQREREKHSRYIPIIGCTANAFNDELHRCLASGMDSVLIKPLMQKDIRNLIIQQQGVRLDMNEINIMTTRNPEAKLAIIEELQKSSEMVRRELTSKNSIDNYYLEIIHRQKGCFALAGFQSGVAICHRLEQIHGIKENGCNELLLLNSMLLRFISLLENEKELCVI
ncbi:response regulator [Serratia ureilytica]|nr:response regulator [Serratia ureilytica]MBJ2092161.1 response regulator [Serratia ureilytica]